MANNCVECLGCLWFNDEKHDCIWRNVLGDELWARLLDIGTHGDSVFYLHCRVTADELAESIVKGLYG